jgi:solute carrier family 35 protein
VLNYATYLCTQLNDALTTSVVGRTKSVVQGVAGLFAFSVSWGMTNVIGLTLNSVGICWYAWERYAEKRRGTRLENVRRGIGALNENFLTRNESQLTLSPKKQMNGFGLHRHPTRASESGSSSMASMNGHGGGG